MIKQIGNTFHLVGRDISYVLYISEYGDIIHYHFGNKIAEADYSDYMPYYAKWWQVAPPGETGLTNLAQEYPSFGHNDLRIPAYTVVNGDGNAISRLRYKSHKIYDGKYSVDGMPSLFAGDSSVQTLELELEDEISGFGAVLYYSVFDEYNVITRSVKLINTSDAQIDITRAMSANLDLPIGEYETVHFAGAWARERDMERTVLTKGAALELSNMQGGSGHQLNPFVMVCTPGAGETHGEVYGFSLIYSGDHTTVAVKDTQNRMRVHMGISPHNLCWKLDKNETFMTPECVLSYSPNGFETISHNYHEVYNNNLCRSKWAKKDRPILINNWEGTYFDFTEEKLLDMAKTAKDAGVELFVLDDGWFGKRNDDTSSLGDWYVNTDKLPNGIDGLAKKINDMGMMFGLWFEPEMVNADSDLYRAHPDWAVKVPGRTPAEMRNQLILDVSKDEVCEYIIDAVCGILSSANISYVKWDMNRYMTDRPCLSYSHKRTLGFYRIMDAICSAFPDVLFEGCAAGGGRFDPGVLAYMPQIWTSDNSEAAARLRIQYSTSMVYPLSAMSAHVTAVPNHQNGRTTSLDFRAAVATTGSFGYELDVTKLDDGQMAEIEGQIKRYKELRTLMRTGTFYRLQNPYDGVYCAWETVSKDKSKAVVMAARTTYTVEVVPPRLKLRGLDADAMYECVETGKCYHGSVLENVGMDIQLEPHDFAHVNITLVRK